MHIFVKSLVDLNALCLPHRNQTDIHDFQMNLALRVFLGFICWLAEDLSFNVLGFKAVTILKL